MMRALSLMAAAVVMAGAAYAADSGQALVDIETAWSKAFVNKNAAFVSNVLADDWVGQDDSGRHAKADLVGDVKSGKMAMTAMTNHDVKARVIGNIAIVQGMDDETSTYNGKDSSGTYSWTDIFENRGGKWVAVASQVTKVAK